MTGDFKIIEYQDSYRAEFLKCFRDLRKKLARINPLRKKRLEEKVIKESFDYWMEVIRTHQGLILLAEKEGKIVGYVVGYVEKPNIEKTLEFFPSKIGRIEDLFVATDYRHQGVGSRLIEEMESYLQKNQCQYINLGVLNRNPMAHNLYTRLGYQDEYIEMLKKINQSQ